MRVEVAGGRGDVDDGFGCRGGLRPERADEAEPVAELRRGRVAVQEGEGGVLRGKAASVREGG